MRCFKCTNQLTLATNRFGLHSKCFAQWFDVQENADFYDIVRRSSSSKGRVSTEKSENKIQSWNTSFFQGKFKKYSAKLEDRHYILKVQEDIAPELPCVELLCNQIAQSIGLLVPDYFLIELFNQQTFVSRNFITEKKGSINLTHIYHYVDNAKSYNCENLIKIIEQETKSFQDIEMFIQTCLFDALIGNHDRHGRNLGFLVTAKSTRLAPIYDNTSALGLEQGEFLKMHFEPRGKITTKKNDEPVAVDYVQEFNRLGFEPVVYRFLNNLDQNLLSEMIENSFCSDLMKEALHRLILRRLEEMQNAL